MAELIRITARRDGFRRAGLAHPARPVEHPAERFTELQLAQLQAEPMLTVEPIEADDTPAPSVGPAQSDGAGQPSGAPAPPAEGAKPAKSGKGKVAS